MAKIVVECSDPNDLDAIEKASEQIQGRCNITYFKQHKAMVEVGISKSERESARIIAKDIGETEGAVRRRIQKGKQAVAPVVPLKPKKPEFNKTNENIEWASWSWNPVTGCLHGCMYCYARDIANRFYKKEKFKPTFRPYRLDAPKNTILPDSDKKGDKSVFVCSMGDLFGKWVKQEWIDAVMKAVTDAPQWNFIFLTKNPERLATIDWPKNAWVGATVDIQARVECTEKVFADVNASVKFIS